MDLTLDVVNHSGGVQVGAFFTTTLVVIRNFWMVLRPLLSRVCVDGRLAFVPVWSFNSVYWLLPFLCDGQKSGHCAGCQGLCGSEWSGSLPSGTLQSRADERTSPRVRDSQVGHKL